MCTVSTFSIYYLGRGPLSTLADACIGQLEILRGFLSKLSVLKLKPPPETKISAVPQLAMTFLSSSKKNLSSHRTGGSVHTNKKLRPVLMRSFHFKSLSNYNLFH